MDRVLVVGCGLSGAVIARQLAEQGKTVEIWERRDHIGGNLYDYVDEHGILVHRYGPHTFHTKKKRLYDFLCRFGTWDEYRLTCGAEIDGKYTPTPFNFQTVDDFYPPVKAMALKEHLLAAFPGRCTVAITEALSHPDVLVRQYAKFLFEKDFSLYTAKQWGVPPDEIDPSVLMRVPLRLSYDEGYFDDPWQVMPHAGYTAFFRNLLDHANIFIHLGIHALDHLAIQKDRLLLNGEEIFFPVIYTGALDELFGCQAGQLPYRSLRFEWKYEDIDSKQNAPVVAYPQAKDYTRITEYKKLPVQNVRGTSYAMEYPLPYYPGEAHEPYYPVLTADSQARYAVYSNMAMKISNLICCGRLADFRYYNMDQALNRALEVCAAL